MLAMHYQFPIGRSRVAHLSIVLLLLIASQNIGHTAEAVRVFKSTDGGRSWSRSDTGLPGNVRINAFGSVRESLLAGTDSGLFVSHDQGQSWLSSAGVARSSGRILAFATLGQNVYAGTDRNGILASADEGVSWAVHAGFPSKNIRSLLVHQGKLYAGSDAQGVFLSKDNGRSWNQLHQGFPPEAQVFALAALKGRVFAGLYSKGLYSWNDQAQRWNKIGPVSPLALATIDDTLVVGHNPGGIYTSDDLGASWFKASSNVFDLSSLSPAQFADLPSEAPVWELASSSVLVIAGTGSGIYYSNDKGRSWIRSRIGLPDESPGVAFHLDRDFVLAGTLTRVTDQREEKR